jgi:hypothetical protein
MSRCCSPRALGALRPWVGSACVALALGCAGRSEIGDGSVDAGVDADVPDAEVDAGTPLIETSDKVDLLLVIDNSRNLEVAHQIFLETVPYLLDRLVNPACVNGLGNVIQNAPSYPEPCPVGERDFRPIRDFHIAVISTSLGGHGADACSPQSPSFNATQDDKARLLSRTSAGGVVPTYDNRGFLAWDPGQAMSPPGDSDIGALSVKLDEILRGVGQVGCGYESQLESIYRFLVDPNPYETITVLDGAATPLGTDTTVLQQRSDFLRPDSAVVTLLLTDENDCSTRDGTQFYLSNQISQFPGGPPFHLPRARSECASSPEDPCCASCGQQAPQGCPPTEFDSSCLLPPMSDLEDPVNLRCFDQKRRFGIDFLNPVDRYVKGFTEATIADRDGNVVRNPLFSPERSPKLFLFTGIVGVPWQDVAVNPQNLTAGYLQAPLIDWTLFFGDPETGAPPGDPLMIESVAPRTGTHPLTGEALEPPTATVALANAINGHERIVAAQDDLQYACIYRRPVAEDCSASTCECVGPPEIDTNPICQQEDGSYSTVQRFVRAVPSLRELAVLSQLGDQAAVASICAPIVTGNTQPIFGYKPAIDAMMRALRLRLQK